MQKITYFESQRIIPSFIKSQPILRDTRCKTDNNTVIQYENYVNL